MRLAQEQHLPPSPYFNSTMAPPPPVHILDQQQFDKYAAAWSRHVSHHQDLSSVFQQPGGGQMQAVRFSFDALQYLLSTVGAQRIKARFVLQENEHSDEKLFSLVLYATDAMDGRVSAYYLAQHMSVAPAPPHAPIGTEFSVEEGGSPDDQTNLLGDQIPNELVHTWLNNWQSAPLKTASMFGSNYGPLTGYTFGIGDFLNSFFYANPYATKELLILFGLHQHYPAFPDCYALKQTFGLVLRIRQTGSSDAAKIKGDFSAAKEACLKAITEATTPAALALAAQQHAAATDADAVGQPFYDFSEPSPPN